MEEKKINKKNRTMNQLLDQSKKQIGIIEGIDKAIELSLPYVSVDSPIIDDLASEQRRNSNILDLIFEDMKKHIEELLK